MNSIYKYVLGLPSRDVQKIKIPLHSKVLSVGMQDGKVVMWCLVKDIYNIDFHVDFLYRIVGTGWEIGGGLTYLGRVDDGPWVWHVLRVET